MSNARKWKPREKIASKLPTSPQSRATHPRIPQTPAKGSIESRLPTRPNTPTHSVDEAVSPLASGDEVVLLDDDLVIEIDEGYVSPLAADSEPTPTASKAPSTRKTTKKQNPVPKGKPTHDTKTGERIEYTPTGRRKRHRDISEPTDNDRKLLTAAYWQHWSTATHLAFAADNSTHNVKARLNELVRRGWLDVNTSETTKLYALSRAGYETMGFEIVKNAIPSRSTLSHRNKLNTLVTFFKIGGKNFEELLHTDALDARRNVEYKNKQTAEYNTMLIAEQTRISGIPEQQRSDSERSILKRRERKINDTPAPPEPKEYRNALQAYPQFAIPERLIVLSLSAKGLAPAKADWEDVCTAILNDPNYPVREAADNSQPTVAEREMMQWVTNKHYWAYIHHDVNGRFGKTHRPDGVLFMPHKRLDDGTIVAQSIQLELEDHKKKVPEYVRLILQTIDHPLIESVKMFVDSTDSKETAKRRALGASSVTARNADTPVDGIKPRVEEAMKKVVMELISRDHTNRNYEDKKTDAQQAVRKAIQLHPTIYLNRHKNGTGMWG